MGEGSPALERLLEAVLERGITVYPTWDTKGYHVFVNAADEEKKEEGFEVEREGKLGRWW